MPAHIRPLAALGLTFALVACVNDAAPLDPYPFVGTWDCEGRNLVLTNISYDDGSQPLPIRSVSQDGRNYNLLFSSGTMIALAAVTETGMTWVSGKTGNQRVCRRLS
ncbi:MAG: hypothetical protein HC783_12345 [Rhodobacteraceae bacterium]|nr:hypothetical protein [Paracoccaceae bacterium]